MSLFRELTRAYVINRLARGGRRRARRRSWHYGHAPRSYSRRPRGRSQVRVTGCCLPIPLGILGVLVAGARILVRR
jgi:hypothetical protein